MTKAVTEISEELFKHPPLDFGWSRVRIWKKNLQIVEVGKWVITINTGRIAAEK
jgi:hypothetical protein